jgi:hypothetical protein
LTLKAKIMNKGVMGQRGTTGRIIVNSLIEPDQYNPKAMVRKQ